MVKADGPADVAAFLAAHADATAYVIPFVDYAGPDGLYRKQRIAFVEGRPFASHMAVSERWMVHYLNAGMAESPDKRAEEARFMADFDTGFAVRNAEALACLARTFGLDYFGVDCAEGPDGRLILFEADVAMIVHDLDPPDLYPYKGPVMHRLMDAFVAALRRRATVAARGAA
jgi:hypothetical protein